MCKRLRLPAPRVTNNLSGSDSGLSHPAEVAEFASSAEAISYDRYQAMAESANEEATRKLFARLAADEKNHLTRLTAGSRSPL